MPRKPRIYYEGALYHVMVRGNNGETVFEMEKEKQEYINIIKKYKEKYRFKIYAYCIMDNHAHLLIEVEKMPLSKIMQGIQQAFTQKYNKKNNRTGHVFQQRYKSVLCQKDEYLYALIKYIHFNPIKAKVAETLDYKWSSHKEYLNYENNLVNIESILSLFSTKKKDAIKEYKKYMEVEEPIIKEEDYKISYEKIEKIIKGIEKEGMQRLTLEKVISETIKYYKINRTELESGKRTENVKEARKMIVLLAKELTKESNKSISKPLGISESGVSKIISRENIGNEGKKAMETIRMSICQA